MALYTVTLNDVTGPDVVSLTDGSTYATLEVSAGRGPKGDGFTGGSYSSSTGQITFTSNDGIGFSTSDIRPEITAAVAAAEAAQAGAETAEAGAEAAQAATESIFDQFGDQYLGPKASDPTVDNDGDPLTEGDIYFNTTDSVLKFYSGTAWVAPESIATTAASDAQAAQAASEAAQAAAETAETNAETAETNAETAETNAAASASAASSSASAASTSADEAAASAASINLSSIDIDGGTIDGTVIGGSTPAAGSFTTGSFTGNVTFGDNDKAIFGAGSDLQVYHDPSTGSYIRENGTGSLFIQSNNNGIIFEKTDGENIGFIDTINSRVVLYNGGDQKLATTSTGIDVDGEITADGLTVDGSAKISSNFPLLDFSEGDTTDLNSRIISTGGQLRLLSANDDFTSTKNRLIVDHATGDISFYEDTGTTAKFFWDASAESLGIGTDSPSSALHVQGATNTAVFESTTNFSFVTVANSGGSASISTNDNDLSLITPSSSGGEIRFLPNSSEAMRIDSSGNVGIGTDSPSAILHVSSSDPEFILTDTSTNVDHSLDGNSGTGVLRLHVDKNSEASDPAYIINMAGSEAMRIDSSGRVGIGTSSPNANLQVKSGSGGGLTLQADTATQNEYSQLGFVPSTNDAANPNAYIRGLRGTTSTGTFLTFGTSNSEAMRIDSSGNVGIGTDSPASLVSGGDGPVLSIGGTDSGLTTGEKAGSLSFITNDSSYTYLYADGITGEIASIAETAVGGGYGMAFYTGVTTSSNRAERVRINMLGNVGIGTSSPGSKLDVRGDVRNGDSGASSMTFGVVDASSNYYNVSDRGDVYVQASSSVSGAQAQSGGRVFIKGGNSYNGNDGHVYIQSGKNLVNDAKAKIFFTQGGEESARFDSSGNLLVGTTDTTLYNNSDGSEGVRIAEDHVSIASDARTVFYVNRQTSDGEIINIRKDGSTVGSIGASGGDVFIGTGDTGLRFKDDTTDIRPWNTSTNAIADGTVDIGDSIARFKDLYLSGGVYLGGTGSANKLDDYEEGNWTPSDGSGAGLTFSNVVGTYTKIGRQVFLVCELQYPSTSDTNAARINGLPFAVDDNFRYGGVISYTTSTALGTAEVTNPAATSICFRPVNQGTQVPNDDISLNVVRFTILYQTTA